VLLLARLRKFRPRRDPPSPALRNDGVPERARGVSNVLLKRVILFEGDVVCCVWHPIADIAIHLGKRAGRDEVH